MCIRSDVVVASAVSLPHSEWLSSQSELSFCKANESLLVSQKIFKLFWRFADNEVFTGSMEGLVILCIATQIVTFRWILSYRPT